jgi:hypothetical protein
MRRFIALLMLVTLTACTTTYDLGHGRVAVTRVSEERSPFGTNVAWTRLDECRKVREEQSNGNSVEVYRECKALTEWTMASSQGQGGQIVSGALIGLGFGLGSAFAPSSSASSSSSSAASAASAPAKHGGH